MVDVHPQPVAVLGGLDDLAAEDLAQPRDAPLHDLRPRRRRGLTPDRLGQRLGADHRARPDRQRLEHHAVAQAQGRGRPVELERTEHGDTHSLNVDPPAGTVKGRDTAVIPDVIRVRRSNGAH